MLKLRFLTRLAVVFVGVLIVVLVPGCGDSKTDVSELLQKSVKAGENGDWRESEKLAKEALKCEPKNPSALLLSAIAAERLGDAETALNNARSAAELAPDDYAANYTYGRMLAQRGCAEEAITPLDRALQARPGDCNALILRGECGIMLNDNTAIDIFTMKKELPPEVKGSPEIQTSVAIYYFTQCAAEQDKTGYCWRKAKEAFTNAYNKAPQNPQVVLNLALFLEKQGDCKQANKHYEEYFKLTADNSELYPEWETVRKRYEANKKKLQPASSKKKSKSASTKRKK